MITVSCTWQAKGKSLKLTMHKAARHSLYLFSDRTIRYYEFENDELYHINDHREAEAQKGIAFMPKRALNVNECEIARAYKVTNSLIEPISFTVPRKVKLFASSLGYHLLFSNMLKLFSKVGCIPS